MTAEPQKSNFTEELYVRKTKYLGRVVIVLSLALLVPLSELNLR